MFDFAKKKKKKKHRQIFAKKIAKGKKKRGRGAFESVMYDI